jgi:hypothetical protein
MKSSVLNVNSHLRVSGTFIPVIPASLICGVRPRLCGVRPRQIHCLSNFEQTATTNSAIYFLDCILDGSPPFAEDVRCVSMSSESVLADFAHRLRQPLSVLEALAFYLGLITSPEE